MNTRPRTLAEAVDQLQQWLTPEQRADFAAQSEEDLIDYHFSLGTRIRNDFGLSDPQSPLLRDCQASGGAPADDLHPDDASMLILGALWLRQRH